MNKKSEFIFSTKIVSRIVSSSLLEFGPVLIFITSFKYIHIYEATMLLMVATIVSTIITYRVQKRIPYLALYVAFITSIFGLLTLHFHMTKFIQMRDTLYDMTCALTLILGLRYNVRFLEIAFDKVLPMSEKAWEKLTYLWIGFFILTGISNEIARSVLSLESWFFFKGCVLVATSLFGFYALYSSYEAKDTQKKVAEN